MIERLERTMWGRVVLYFLMLPFVLIATPIQFAQQYLIERQFDIGEL